MPKKRQRHQQAERDLSINESANSNNNTRSKKSFGIKNLETIVKQIQDLNVEDDLNPIENEEDEDEEEIVEFKNKPNIRRRRLKGQVMEDPNHTYANYHIDIWHCISKHIIPEDVGRFALICRQTASVVTSAQFWFRLYKRYYRADDELPMRLKPECMVRLYGLRASTIRSLFFTYDPFVQRLKTAPKDIHTTERKQVVAMWTQQSALKLWHFFFKIKCKLNQNCRAVAAEEKLKNNKMLEYLSDVYMNRDEGCQVLVLSTTSYRPLPQFFGQSVNLYSITQTLSHGFCSYKITLRFTSHINNELIGAVTFDPVVTAKVYDWWMPEYVSVCS